MMIVGLVPEALGASEEIKGIFDPNVTEFWQGGPSHKRKVCGRPGDQGTIAAFVDDSGKLMVESLYINHVKVRGIITDVKENNLIVQQESLPLLNSLVVLSFHPDAVTFDNNPVNVRQLDIKSLVVVAQGELLGPSLIDVYRIETYKPCGNSVD